MNLHLSLLADCERRAIARRDGRDAPPPQRGGAVRYAEPREWASSGVLLGVCVVFLIFGQYLVRQTLQGALFVTLGCTRVRGGGYSSSMCSCARVRCTTT